MAFNRQSNLMALCMNQPHKYVLNLDKESALNIRLDELSKKRERVLNISSQIDACLKAIDKEINLLG